MMVVRFFDAYSNLVASHVVVATSDFEAIRLASEAYKASATKDSVPLGEMSSIEVRSR